MATVHHTTQDLHGEASSVPVCPSMFVLWDGGTCCPSESGAEIFSFLRDELDDPEKCMDPALTVGALLSTCCAIAPVLS